MSFETSSSTTDHLVRLALDEYRFGRDDCGEVFAVAKSGPNIARYILGSDQDEFRRELASSFHAKFHRAPNSGQLNDATQVLLGNCRKATPERAFVRVGLDGEGSVIVDLGRADGKAIRIPPHGDVPWRVVDRSPVVFRRSQLTGEMPIPLPGGNLGEIKEIFDLSAVHWQLLLGWMLAAFEPEMPHPILAIFGPAGAGKSCLARLAVRLCDPSPAPLRSPPRTDEEWHVTASSCWVHAMDNLSAIKPWFSDALCAAVTGNSRVARKLYANKSLTVTSLRIPIVLTGIDLGSLMGDLGDRLVLLELPPRASRRQLESQLDLFIEERLPHWFGALLEAVAATRAAKRRVERPKRLERMADYHYLLAAADSAGVTCGAAAAYESNRKDTAGQVAEGDEVAEAVHRFLKSQPDHSWTGIATDLLLALSAVWTCNLPPKWPKAANQLSGRMQRLSPVLAAQGVQYRRHRDSRTRKNVISLSFSKKEEGSSASSAAEQKQANVRERPVDFPDDRSIAPGRSVGVVNADQRRFPDDDRTMAGRSSASPPSSNPRPASHMEKPPIALPTKGSIDEAQTPCRCGSRRVLAVPIHNGQSLRQDCADCGRFLDFSDWNSC